MANDTLLSIGIQDVVGARKRVNVFFVNTVTLAQITGWLADAAVALNGFLDGIITDAYVQLDVALPGGLATSPVAGSTVRRGALFTFDNPTRFAWDQYIPAIDTDILVGTEVDQSAGGVVDWLAAMVDGVTVSSVLIQPTNGSGEDLTSTTTAVETFRK
jgi:hypothetical protein